jgi:CHAD domain-containing protein
MLDSPAGEVLGRIATRQLHAAASAARKFERSQEAKDLHAFRVAIRRLRSLQGAYRPWMGPSAGRKVRRRLRDLTRSTNAARDLDVQIGWLQAERERLPPGARAGATAWLRRLRSQRRASYDALAESLPADFRRASRTLRKRLQAGGKTTRATFGSAYCAVSVTEAKTLLAAMPVLGIPGNPERVHVVRKRIRRLRYLVEPLRQELPEARAVVRILKDLQRSIGGMRDLRAFGTMLERAMERAPERDRGGLRAMAISVARRRAELLADLGPFRRPDGGPLQPALTALRAAAGCKVSRGSARSSGTGPRCRPGRSPSRAGRSRASTPATGRSA